MNHIYRSIWHEKSGAFIAVSEKSKSAGIKISYGRTATAVCAHFTLVLTISLVMSCAANVYALPEGGVVMTGEAGINSGAAGTTINQTTQNVAINWQSFNIGRGEAVRFVQPDSNSVALNRVLGADPSNILGSLSANGNVFLINPNGVLFGRDASVNVGGLVASTLNITDGDFMAGTYRFGEAGNGSVINQGSIRTSGDGGYVALLGASVSNEGVISAKLGTVALVSGNAVTLDMAGDGLLNVTVDQGAMDALVQNGGLLRADGGQVLLTAQAAGDLLPNVVNNTGLIQAQIVENHNGTIKLLGGMQNGTMKVGGTLDASAPNGGDGGFVETSAAHLKIADSAIITTQSAQGKTGTWLIDPQDFTIAAGQDIAGATLSSNLVTNSIVISTVTTGINTATNLYGVTPGNGDIFVNEAVTWTPTPNPTTLTLNAFRDVNVNAAITTTGGSIKVNAGGDVNANAAMTMTTTGGNITLTAADAVNLNQAITTTGGNLTATAGSNLNVSGISTTGLTTTNGRLVLSAGNDGTGAGTLVFAAGAPTVTVTGPTASAKIYTPLSYDTPTDYSGNFTLTGGATLSQYQLVFVQGLTGPEGPAGPAGPAGIQGIQGVEGIQGLQGIQGITGDKGLQGFQGLQGIPGEQGIPGLSIQGPQGEQGIAGLSIQGPQGEQGIPGLSIQGPQGEQGIAGLSIQGPQGDQGVPGSTEVGRQ